MNFDEIAKWIIEEAIEQTDAGWDCYIYYDEIADMFHLSEASITVHREDINKALIKATSADIRTCEYDDDGCDDSFSINFRGVGYNYNLALVRDSKTNKWRLRTYEELIIHAHEENYELSEDEKSYYKELMEMKNEK